MTVVKSARMRRSNGHDSHPSVTARWCLSIACLWPLFLWFFFRSAPSDSNNHTAPHRNIALKFRDVFDRVDIMGYGPTHPRVAVVIVGDNKDNLLLTVENVFQKTDVNRIFLTVVVADGIEEDSVWTERLKQIDHGTMPHWHTANGGVHVHAPGDANDPHGQKVHVMYSPEKRGLAESRRDAVDFIQILEHHHLESGLKSDAEDLILLLLQAGAGLTSRKWLTMVTEALIVPPPILGKNDANTVAMKLANAVAFNLDGPGKRNSFDTTFTPILSDPSAAEFAASNGESYATPALNAAGVAMRLDTYLNLPSQDLSLPDDHSVNLDLALNLWLCADGIDMLRDLDITLFGHRQQPAPLPPPLAARFAVAWMDEVMQKRFYNAYIRSFPQLTYLEWQTYMAAATAEPHFSRDLTQKCRSFQWYIEEVNTDLIDLMIQSPDVAELDQRKEKVRPQEPLCAECLRIVQQAEPVPLAFVDVSDGYTDHPHMGAVDADLRPGYVHDETALRRNPPPKSITPDALRALCLKRDNNYRMLHEKVFVDLEYEQKMVASGKRRDQVFCLVYTIDLFHEKIPAIRETWGPKCDGFMVASNKTDVALGTVNILHQGPEEYNNIWQKVRSMWSYVYDHYYEKYDWFHIGGDDLYLIVENLRYYVESEEIRTAANGGTFLPDGTEQEQTPLFLGRRFAYLGDMNDIFNSGGSGYTMNKAALKLLVVEGFPKYFPNLKTFSEDTMIARVFKKFNVFPYETKDKSGGERYMPFLPGHHYGYRLPQDSESDWYAKYSINIKEGADHCAARSIAFHYIKDAAMMNRLHALLYHLCPIDTQ